MRHRNKIIKIGRSAAQTKSIVRNLMTSLVLHERIETTIPRAKAAQRAFDRLITSLRKYERHNQVRTLRDALFVDAAGKKVVDVLLKRFEGRPSGYTRIIKTGVRKGDDASVALLELV